MPFSSGSQGADANYGKTFMETILHPALLTAGFTYVEERTQSTATARVYKSAAGSNYFGQDWYLIVYRGADTSTPAFGVCEVYDSANHVCKNYAPKVTNLTPTAQFAVNDATGKAPTDTANVKLDVSLTLSSTGYQWWMSLTLDRVVIAGRYSSADTGVYVGLYDDLQATAISPFPLVVTTLTANSMGGATTREPNTTTQITNNFQVGFTSLPYWTTNTGNETYTQKTWLSRAMFTGRGNTSSAYRGLLRDVWYSSVNGVNGDTLAATIAGASKTLVQTRQAGSYFVDNSL